VPALELIEEAKRQLSICNACRYCEGFCAVWPAMELRRTFTDADVLYLSNLCFDCRACYYACQFAPPHLYDVNIPKVFSELRTDTYQDYAWPRVFSKMVKNNARAVSIMTLVVVVAVLALTWLFRGSAVLFGVHVGEGAFYRVIPLVAMVAPAIAICLYAFAVFCMGAVRFWRDTRATPGDIIDIGALGKATGDAFGLRYLKGDGSGCNYPDEQFQHARRIFHHFTFYGFMLDLASTTVAAIYQDVIGWEAPYPMTSIPVVLGTAGGTGLLIGTSGLLYLKWRMDRIPSAPTMTKMDVSFLLILWLTAASGLLLLAFRETAAMGTLLAIHLGIVLAFFIMIPYGKFAHVIYRYAALVRNAIEQRRVAATAPEH
jgi:citrate/tricarballylate utilization protein